jgi:hypothetical protein
LRFASLQTALFAGVVAVEKFNILDFKQMFKEMTNK